MAIDLEIIRNFDLFEELKEDELKKFASFIDIITVHEGEIILNRGDRAHTLYLILDGSFMVYFHNGKALNLDKKGEIIGWSTIVSPFEYTGTAVALTEGRLVAVQGDELKLLIRSDAELSGKIMERINSILLERRPYFEDSDR